MTTFTPTHRTNRAIGKIKACSPIRVARYTDTGFFSHTLGRLGVKDDHIEYRYYGDEVQFWDSSVLGSTTKYVLPDDYVITDGEHYEVTNTDSGWDLLPAETPKSEGVTLVAWGDNHYTLRGDEGGEIQLAASQLYDLVQIIHNRVPEPSPIENARFITAFHQTLGEYHVLAKFDDAWYDDNGNEHTEKQVLDNYDEIEVIR